MARKTPTGPVWEQIQRLDLSKEVGAAARNKRWSKERAARAEYWYRAHLYMATTNGGRSLGGIARDADVIWHMHILDSRKYRQDTNHIYGAYLEHTPSYHYAAGQLSKMLDSTKDAYKAEFGQVPPMMDCDCVIPVFVVSA
jgi:hypothetical protein